VPGEGWGAPALVENFEDTSGGAQVAAYADGDVIAVWQTEEDGRWDLWSTWYIPGGGWGTPIRIEANNASDALAGRVVVDADGVATVVWNQPDGLWRSLWANRHTPGGGWGTPAPIETADGEDADSHSLAVDADGRVTVVWRQHGQTGNAIWSNRFQP
jgi:hypothetical protein